MSTQNASSKLAIRGYDVVAYFDGDALAGDPAINSEHDGAVYYFASEDNKTLFERNPSDYLPQYGGWCAFAVANGMQFDIDPTNFLVKDGQLYLFYNGIGGDKKAEWLANEGEFLQQADAKWASGF